MSQAGQVKGFFGTLVWYDPFWTVLGCHACLSHPLTCGVWRLLKKMPLFLELPQRHRSFHTSNRFLWFCVGWTTFDSIPSLQTSTLNQTGFSCCVGWTFLESRGNSADDVIFHPMWKTGLSVLSVEPFRHISDAVLNFLQIFPHFRPLHTSNCF